MKTKRQAGVYEGFEPCYDGESRLLILGSFPSVKSREVGFYYGNKQNRFWKTVYGFFGERVSENIEDKKDFLRRRRIALWDVVVKCEIVGSSDSSIRGEEVADIPSLLKTSKIERIYCNGTKCYGLLGERFPQLLSAARLLPSTSPANPRFSAQVWYDALQFLKED